MTLSLAEVSQISQAVLQDFRNDLDVVNVASIEGGVGRIELLVTIAGCHPDACVLMVNISRTDPATFEADLRLELRAAIDRHNRRR